MMSTGQGFFIGILLFVCIVQSGCDRCSSADCGNGTCEKGTCICPEGFSGSDCSIENLCETRVVECGDNGACDNGQCACNEGYSGDHCQKEDKCITNNVTCLNGGTCQNGLCDCIDKYTGERCEIWDECIGISCQHGIPCDNGECMCDAFTSGPRCENKIIDQYIGSYSGTWDIKWQDGSGQMTMAGSIEFFEDPGSSDKLNAKMDAQSYKYDLLLEFLQGDFAHFKVERCENSEDVSGYGGIDNGKLDLEFQYASFTTNYYTLIYHFTED